MSTILFRPVGLHELALIWESEMREYPPRLPHQPVFYPVANAGYANQIARDWNTKDEGSGFAGFVTRFAVAESYLSQFEPRTVGSSAHVEYWIPAEELTTFNVKIEGLIGVQEGFFGKSFRGWIPDQFGLKGRDAIAQFVALAKTWNYSRMDFVLEVATNCKAVFLNFAFWRQFDFAPYGIDQQQKEATIENLKQAWKRNQMDKPLPTS